MDFYIAKENIYMGEMVKIESGFVLKHHPPKKVNIDENRLDTILDNAFNLSAEVKTIKELIKKEIFND